MDPLAALRRIAYLLETEHAPPYKARAFRQAAVALEALDATAIEELSRSGRIRSLPGIGERSAEVIAEALSGKVPAYLADLEAGDAAGSSPDGIALRAALRGDCHSHSDWSDGGSPIAEMASAARELGHEYLALTDHSARLTVAHGLNADRLRAQLDIVAAINKELDPFRILTGIEVDILEDGTLDQDESLLQALDVVVASVHSKLRMEEKPMTARMLRAVENPLVDVLGHCTGRIIVGRGRPQSSFDAEAVFTSCAAHHTAVEINSRPERRDPPEDLMALALALGCEFTIDTDAHAPGQLEWLSKGCERAAAVGVVQARVVNTRSLEGILAWTAEGGATRS